MTGKKIVIVSGLSTLPTTKDPLVAPLQFRAIAHSPPPPPPTSARRETAIEKKFAEIF